MIVIIMISLIIYLITLSTIYYKMPEIKKENRFKSIFVGEIIILVITFLIVNIAGSKIEGFSKENLSTAKIYSLLIFAPTNGIILAPIAKSLNQLKEKKIKKDKFYKKIVIILVIFLICLIIEKDYIQYFIQELLRSVKWINQKL